jgi:hypothetical protein
MARLQGPLRALLLFGVLLTPMTPLLPQGIGPATGLKQNLDLPFCPLGDAESDDDAPEIVILYAQQFEGDTFVFVSDPTT